MLAPPLTILATILMSPIAELNTLAGLNTVVEDPEYDERLTLSEPADTDQVVLAPPLEVRVIVEKLR